MTQFSTLFVRKVGKFKFGGEEELNVFQIVGLNLVQMLGPKVGSYGWVLRLGPKFLSQVWVTQLGPKVSSQCWFSRLDSKVWHKGFSSR
jgi:hypothetical protein